MSKRSRTKPSRWTFPVPERGEDPMTCDDIMEENKVMCEALFHSDSEIAETPEKKCKADCSVKLYKKHKTAKKRKYIVFSHPNIDYYITGKKINEEETLYTVKENGCKVATVKGSESQALIMALSDLVQRLKGEGSEFYVNSQN